MLARLSGVRMMSPASESSPRSPGVTEQRLIASGGRVIETNGLSENGATLAPEEREVLLDIIAWLSTECWDDPAMDRATVYSLVRQLNARSLRYGS